MMNGRTIIADTDVFDALVWSSAKLAKEGFESKETDKVRSALADKLMLDAEQALQFRGFDFSRITADGGCVTVGCAFCLQDGKMSDLFVIHLIQDAKGQPVAPPEFATFKDFREAPINQQALDFFENKICDNIKKVAYGGQHATCAR